MSVSAVLVSHGHAAELQSSLPALVPQVDEVVVVANLPGSAAGVPAGVRVIENTRPRPLAGERQCRHRRDERRPRPLLESRRGGRARSGRRPRRR